MNENNNKFNNQPELIPVLSQRIGDQEINAINARELHAFLEVNTKFSQWIQDRIENYTFQEGQDFFLIFGKSTGGRPKKEYFLSLDMAKELAMLERNEKGKQARQYFIEVEKRFQAVRKELSTPEILELLTERTKKILAIETEQKFKLDTFDRLFETEGTISIRNFAKMIQIEPNRLFEILREHELLDDWNIAYQRYIAAGYFKIIETIKEHLKNPLLSSAVTGKGQIYLLRKLREWGYIVESEAI